MILTTAAMCLAVNIYMESRSEPLIGQIAVAEVTWNRANHHKRKVCDVVAAPYQFSWTIDKLKKNRRGQLVVDASSWTTKLRKNKRGKYIDMNYVNVRAWIVAQKVAKDVMNGMVLPVTRGSTFYHADYVNPRWNRDMRHVKTIGRHLFYRSI